ncbi:uncharacterized protein PAC_15922 [Phialocephala subalpina]|uniref:Uncharacterized protein n=1 Tax=Phialocephala subalpina TaxID=576137 RepID=A0A1L7XLV4_9HELO|nr:uncharacterized protein PAC_15922 [Phialocephala subalpina]
MITPARSRTSSRTGENCRRRKHTVFKKAHEFGKLHHAKIGLFIYQSGRYFTYRSSKKLVWPSWEEIQQSYPLPKDLLPEDFEASKQDSTKQDSTKQDSTKQDSAKKDSRDGP